MIKSFEHRAIPPSIHFVTPNPRIDFEGLNVRVLQHAMKLPDVSGHITEQKPVIVGISSFGMGGSIVHMIVAEYPAEQYTHKHNTNYAHVHATPTPTPTPTQSIIYNIDVFLYIRQAVQMNAQRKLFKDITLYCFQLTHCNH